MRENGKYEIVNPNGDVVGRVDNLRKANKLCDYLERQFGGRHGWQLAA